MFGTLDIAVLAAYFTAILTVGLWFGRGEETTDDYFLGGRRQHWLVVGLSIIATEVSALTFIGVPAQAFVEGGPGDWHYLQMYAGAVVGRLLIVYLLLPAFYRQRVTTVYEYLGLRFGPATRVTASLLFFSSRLVGSGIRLLAASLAIAVVFDWPLTYVVLGASSIAVLYTTFGGIKAIIWTDGLQAAVFMGGGIAAVVFLCWATPGTLGETLHSACEAGQLRIFDWSFSLNSDKAFWLLMVYSTLQNMAALGTDQDLTQRMLTCPDLRRAQRALIFNLVIGLPVVCLFLLVGTLMYAYYQHQPAGTLPAELASGSDRLFPHFIAYALPAGYGLKGLLVAGVFAAAMSSLDSALGAMSSTAVTDFYRPYFGRNATQTQLVWIARVLVVLFGAALAAIAIAMAGCPELLWEAFKWAGLILGALLGVFLLAVTTRRRGSDAMNPIGMLTSVAILIAVKTYSDSHPEQTFIAWPWWIVIGTGWTYGFGAIFRTPPRK